MWPLTTALICFFVATTLCAETTNILSDAEIQGRQLAQQLLEQRPAENFTNTGVLKIKDAKGKRVEIPVSSKIILIATNWLSVYETFPATNKSRVLKLTVTHDGTNANGYESYFEAGSNRGIMYPPGMTTMIPFAGSDFWIADLGLEFFHWPGQKILKKEFRRNCGCVVLESTNSNPSTNGYSRVDSWIDEESSGIVMARAYDAQGRLLKEFYPKDIKKVNGQWQVESMEIYNVQTGSHTRLVFDVKAP